jgi:hypothetical protein
MRATRRVNAFTQSKKKTASPPTLTSPSEGQETFIIPSPANGWVP